MTLSKQQPLARFLFLIIFSTLLGCSSSIDTDIDKNVLPTLKKFQKIIAEHEIEGGYNYIVESNFNRLFHFLDKSDKEEIYQLFKKGQINRIEVWDKKCILIKIRPDFNNRLTKSTWQELYIAYYDSCECVCHKRINQIDIPQEKISTIGKKWYKVIATNKRYIGG